jgi:hypothetical protein
MATDGRRDRIMKRLRSLCLLLVVSAGGILGGGGRAAVAVVSIASSSTTTVAYSGTVHGQPENVYLSGLVQISTVVVNDPDLGTPPRVMVTVDFSNVTGQGLSTKTKYVAGGNQVLVRPLVNGDVVNVVFPFYPSGTNGTVGARSALASFTLNYDTTTGTSTGVAASTTADTSLAPQ